MRDYEESVSFLGKWGHFQLKVFILLCAASLAPGYNIFSFIFLVSTPQHHCNIPACSNLSEEWILASIPVVQVDGQLRRSSCSRYELETVQTLSAMGIKPSLEQKDNSSTLESNSEVMLSSLKQEGCKDGWIYSTDFYLSSVVTEFNLVCSEKFKQRLTSLAYFLGALSGCLISGQISDRFGRKPVLFGGIAILTVFSCALAFATSWAMCTVLYFMMGLGQMSSYIVLFVLGSEMQIGSPRVLFSSLWMPIAYVFGMMLLPGVAYYIRNWRHLSLTMMVPGVACIPLWWLIPESPRWLVSRGHVKEAEAVLRSAALENRVEAPTVIFHSINDENVYSQEAETFSVLDLLKTTNIRRITLVLWFLWFSVNVTYFGLSFNMSTLSGNPYLNHFLLSVIEIPAFIASYLTASRLPRHCAFIIFNLLGALAVFLIQFTLHSHPYITLVLVLLGKFGSLAGEGILYVYTGELAPTVIRNTLMSSCAMFARVGSSVSPYLLDLAVFYQLLPWIVVGSLSLFSVLLCALLPETFKRPLPDSIAQMPVLMWPLACKPHKKDKGISAEDQTSETDTCL